jgi:hypothetical protein
MTTDSKVLKLTLYLVDVGCKVLKLTLHLVDVRCKA